MDDEIQLMAESWSEGTSGSHEETRTKVTEKQLPDRPQPRLRGPRRCAIRDCTVTFNGASPMVRHILEGHCPAGVEDPSCLVQFLRELARLLRLPQEGKNDERALDDLRAFVQRSFPPVNWGFTEKWLDRANALAKCLGSVPVSPLDVERVGRGLIVHVGMLAHPRVIAILLNKLTPGERGRVRQMVVGRPHSWGVARVPVSRSYRGPSHASAVLQASGPRSHSGEVQHSQEDWESEYEGSQEQGTCCPAGPRWEVIDAHWHPTRMSVRLDLSSLAAEIERLPGSEEYPVSVVGGCAVYVDGPTPSGECVPETGWVTAVGFHPTQVAGVTEGSIRALVDQCVERGWAIGEVGLDYCRGTGWGHQRWVLGEIFRLVTPLTPVVLHLRGAPSDPLGREPMMDCHALLAQSRVPLWVPLYLHSFSGGPSQVDEWLATGRVVFFGISGLVYHFSQEQLQGVRRVPPSRLLVETDSPHLRVGQGEMTPGQIGLTYRRVAEVCGVEVPALVERVKENFKSLFGQQLRGIPAR